MQARVASWFRSPALALLVLAPVALGCGGQAGTSPENDPPREATPIPPRASDSPASSATPAAATSAFNVCPGPLGTEADLAATPRADENLEFLALALQPNDAVVSHDNYERVVADVAAIRALVPALASIVYRPQHDGRSILVAFEENAMQALSDDAFGGWDCLNAALGASVGGVTDVFPVYTPLLTLRGVHNMPRVKQLYEQLPGISTEIYPGRPDGPTWCVGRSGNEYEYVIDAASGGCSTGCRDHEAHRFSTRAAGEVTPQEVWISTEGDPAPDWYTRLCQ